MTEEQQGGTAPEPEAKASAADQASEQAVAAVAVADEPAASQTTDTTSEPPAPAFGAERPADASPNGRSAEEVGDPAQAGDSAEGATAQADMAPAGSTTAPAGSAEALAQAGSAEAPAQATSVAPAVAEDDFASAPAASDEEPEEAPKRELGPEPTTMEELLAEQDSDIKSFKHGDVVEGKVVRIDKDEILVDIGAKSEGVVSNRELYGRHGENQPQLTIGDVVLVYVLQPESQEGHVVLSLRRAGLERKWRAMQEQFETGVIIEAPVIDHNKGGLIVDCGIRGFVPISQIVDFPRRPQNDQPRDAAQEIAEKLQPFVGRKLRLKILEVNRKANRLILSEKVALYEERREKRDELFSSLQVSQKVTGTVRSIAPFGVFIDLGGIDGLVHKSELSWNKVNNPEAGYKVGDEVEAEVIDINHERGRISLSIRRLQPDPWHSTVADFKVGDVIDGSVTKLVNFGAFVRVRDGLEGLIHISELSHQRVAHPGDVVHEGQQLKLKIISLDSERHRLGLSLKQAEEPPARTAPEPGQPGPSGQPAAAAQPGPSGQPAAPRGDRRPRTERGFSMADAVQEPEGGIDNTLAAAFAQVREQLAASEEARATASDDGAPAAVVETEAPPATEEGQTEEAPAETAAEGLAEGVAEAEGDSETPAAPAPKTRAKAAKASTPAASKAEAPAKPEASEPEASEPEASEPQASAAIEAPAETGAEAVPEAVAEGTPDEPPAEGEDKATDEERA